MALDQIPNLQIHHNYTPVQAQVQLLLQLLTQIRGSGNNGCVELLNVLQQEKLAHRLERSRCEELELQLKNATVLIEDMSRKNNVRNISCLSNEDLENEKLSRLQVEVGLSKKLSYNLLGLFNFCNTKPNIR
jgi:hypothetical protein